MARISGPQIAKRAGVDLSYIDQLAGLGILEPDPDGNLPESAVRRVRIVQTLEGIGLPLDGLSEALRAGVISLAFIDTPTYERWAALSDVTFRELGEQTGVPAELLSVIRVAMGYARPEPHDRVREDEMAVVPLMQLFHENGFRATTMDRVLRVYGESMRRVAESESDWWRDEVMMPIIHAGAAPAAMMEAAGKLSPAMAEASDQAIMAIYHGQQANSWMRNILEGLESAMAGAGIHEAVERVPAICFLDLTGYTRLTEERGDIAAADLARNLSSLVEQHSKRHGGTAVKWLGDGVMFHFPEPGKGVLAALDMVDAAAGIGLPPAHVGLHAGPVLFQEGDYFGRTVNIAARIADSARPGEVVVSQEVVDASSDDPVIFDEIGPVELKGVSDVFHLHGAHRRA